MKFRGRLNEKRFLREGVAETDVKIISTSGRDYTLVLGETPKSKFAVHDAH